MTLEKRCFLAHWGKSQGSFAPLFNEECLAFRVRKWHKLVQDT